MIDSCPVCKNHLDFIGQIDQQNSFYKCTDGCHRVFERVYDVITQNFKYIDIYMVLEEIKKNRVAE